MQHSAACSRHSGLQRCTAGKFGLTWTQPSHAALCSTAGHVSLSSLYLPFTPTTDPQVMWGEANFVVWCYFYLFKGNRSCYCQHLKTANSRQKYIFVKCLVTCIVLFKRIFGLFVTNLVLFSQISICVEGINPRFCDVVRRHHIIDSPVQTLHLHLLKSTPSLVVHRHVFRVITKIIHTLPDWRICSIIRGLNYELLQKWILLCSTQCKNGNICKCGKNKPACDLEWYLKCALRLFIALSTLLCFYSLATKLPNKNVESRDFIC